MKEVCRSLLRQGFRRQILLTAHGPAHCTVSHAVREFFEETKCPIVYLDVGGQFGRVREKGLEASFNKMIWGAYYLLGRLDEIPADQKPTERAPLPEALRKLLSMKAQVGYFYGEETHHGWWPEKAMSAEDRVARAKEGVQQIELVIESIDPKKLVQNMRDLDAFVQNEVLPKHGEHLP